MKMHDEKNTSFKTSDFMRFYILKLVPDSCKQLIQLYSTSINFFLEFVICEVFKTFDEFASFSSNDAYPMPFVYLFNDDISL